MPKQFKKKLLYVKNKEKHGIHEKWDSSRDELNFPHPFRMLLLGGVNSGKTNTVKNVIARIEPPFKQIYLLHCGGDFTTEYNELDYTVLTEIPVSSDPRFDGKEKSLIVIEDKSFENLNRQQKLAYNRVFGYMSTHRNISIILTSQGFFDVPAPLRRMSNIYVVWCVQDSDLLKTIGRRVGLSKQTMMSLAANYYTHYRDSLWFDRTASSPFPVRKNGYDVIDIKDLEKL